SCCLLFLVICFFVSMYLNFSLHDALPIYCGYVLARPWWREGLMTEVLTEVTVWALRQPSVFRIGAVCDFENIGSARVLEKAGFIDRKSTRLNSSHLVSSYAVFCLKKKNAR